MRMSSPDQVYLYKPNLHKADHAQIKLLDESFQLYQLDSDWRIDFTPVSKIVIGQLISALFFADSTEIFLGDIEERFRRELEPLRSSYHAVNQKINGEISSSLGCRQLEAHLVQEYRYGQNNHLLIWLH